MMTPEDTPVSPAFGLLILTAALANSLAMVPLYPVLPAISQHFADVPYAPALVRGLVTAVSLALVLGAPMAGYIVERYPMRRVLLTAVTLFTLTGMAGFFIDNLWLLLASRVVLGLADAGIGTIVIALIATRLDPVRRNRWIGWFTFAGAAGALVFIPLAGFVAQFGWRMIFLFYGVGFVILVSALIAMKPGEGDDEVRRPVGLDDGTIRLSFLALLPLTLVGLGIASGAVENTTHLFLPFHLVEIGENSPSRIAQAVLPIAVGGAISAFFYGQVRRRLSIGSTFAFAFLTGGLALIWIGMAQSYAMVTVAAAFLGLGVGLLAPNINAFAAVYGAPEHRARHIGIARGAFFTGAPLAQLVLEPVSRFAGSGMAIVTLGCASLLLMLWPLVQRRRLVGVME